MLSNLLALFAGLVLWAPGGQAPIRPPVLPKSWQVLAFRQLVKCYRAAVLGVVLNTPQEDPTTAPPYQQRCPRARNSTDALGHQQLKSRPSPQTPSRTHGKNNRGGGVLQTCPPNAPLVGRCLVSPYLQPAEAWNEQQTH